MGRDPGGVPTLFLMVGLPGAGKTTLAKQLEQERPALRLTPDEWMARLFGDGYDEAARAAVEATQWEVAARALRLGVDVVLDFGFWGRSERDDFRERAAELGARTKVCFLDVPREVLLERLEGRNRALPPDTFVVTEQHLDRFIEMFQPPDEEEL